MLVHALRARVGLDVDVRRHLLLGDVGGQLVELASLRLEEGYAEWSRNEQALFVRRVRLSPFTVRAVAMGATSLFQRLRGCKLAAEHLVHALPAPIELSYVWGDYELPKTGEPELAEAIFLRGLVLTPDLVVVDRYRREFAKRVPSEPISP